MNRKIALIGTAVLLMNSSGAWADEHETMIRHAENDSSDDVFSYDSNPITLGMIKLF